MIAGSKYVVFPYPKWIFSLLQHGGINSFCINEFPDRANGIFADIYHQQGIVPVAFSNANIGFR